MTALAPPSPRPYRRIALLGAGAWGAALAAQAAASGAEARLWSRRPEQAAEIAARRRHPALGDALLPERLTATADLARALDGAEAALLTVPSSAIRETARRLAPHAPEGPIILCAKGIEQESGLRLSEAAAEEIPGAAFGALSGPSFAAEVARGLPTAVALAAPDLAAAERLAATLRGPRFSVEVTADLIGVEIGGAMKNVIAIACGAAQGLGLGANAQALLLTRGLAEMTRLALRLGGRAETLLGLAGLGDLSLTCASPQSRNLRFGRALGAGEPAAPETLTEGVAAAAAIHALGAKLGLTLPIAAAVRAMTAERADPAATLETLWRALAAG